MLKWRGSVNGPTDEQVSRRLCKTRTKLVTESTKISQIAAFDQLSVLDVHVFVIASLMGCGHLATLVPAT
jgi:hypothetical protein